MIIKDLNKEELEELKECLRGCLRDEMPDKLKEAFIEAVLTHKNSDSRLVEELQISLDYHDYESKMLLCLKNIWINEDGKFMDDSKSPQLVDYFWVGDKQYQIINNIVESDMGIRVCPYYDYKKGMKNTACSWNSGYYENDYGEGVI